MLIFHLLQHIIFTLWFIHVCVRVYLDAAIWGWFVSSCIFIFCSKLSSKFCEIMQKSKKKKTERYLLLYPRGYFSVHWILLLMPNWFPSSGKGCQRSLFLITQTPPPSTDTRVAGIDLNKFDVQQSWQTLFFSVRWGTNPPANDEISINVIWSAPSVNTAATSPNEGPRLGLGTAVSLFGVRVQCVNNDTFFWVGGHWLVGSN